MEQGGTRLAAAIREKHGQLLRELDGARHAIGSMDLSHRELVTVTNICRSFLHGELIPYMHAEEKVLLPAISALGQSHVAPESHLPHCQQFARLVDDVHQRLDRARSGGEAIGAELADGVEVLGGKISAHFKTLAMVHIPALDAALTTEAATEILLRMAREIEKRRQ